ncbi:MAG: hypothetical protein WCO84_07205 [bacterium]
MELGAEVKNIIFVSEGGLGRVISSTAVVAKLKKKYPDKRILVVAGFPDVFLYNPDVYKVFRFDNPLYFYDDFVTPESRLMHVEPYREHGYLHGNKHLITAWCDMLGLDPEGARPILHFLKKEEEAAQIYVDKITAGGKKKFVLLQWTGGIVPKEKNAESYVDSVSRMHKRSISKSVAQKLVNKLISRDYVVGAVQSANHPDLEGVQRIEFPIRNVMALLKYSDHFIGIDSFLQHAAAAMGVTGVVVWGGTKPERLGYPENVNLTKKACPTPFCHRPNSYIFDANPSGFIWNCPHDEKCMDYDADEIITAFEGLTKREE